MIVLVVLMIGHHARRRVYWAVISMKPADAIAAGKLIEDLSWNHVRLFLHHPSVRMDAVATATDITPYTRNIPELLPTLGGDNGKTVT